MIHTFKQGGYNIVLDVASGSVHIVDEVAYDKINAFENLAEEQLVESIFQKYAAQGVSKADVEECYADIVTLKEEGKLFAEDEFKPNAEALAKRNPVIKVCACTSRTPATSIANIVLRRRASITARERL